MKILFLDDEYYRHKAIQKIIKNTNAKISAFWTGQEALKSLKKNEYDLVMLDHDLKIEGNTEFNGIDVCQGIVRLYPKHINTVFIIHSLNPLGAKNMSNCLSKKGYEVHVIPRAWELLEFRKNKWIIDATKIQDDNLEELATIDEYW